MSVSINMHSRDNDPIKVETQVLKQKDGTHFTCVRLRQEVSEVILFPKSLEELEEMSFQIQSLIMEIRLMQEDQK